tara:strand:+ start:316 stop:864 length:549 start_codon:yes stop_codon:yes gene_type:complete
MSTISKANDSKYLWLIGVLSVVIPIAVAVLIFKPSSLIEFEGKWVYLLPHINGVINTVTSIFLLLGVYFIKNGKRNLHELCMTVSFVLGSIFLVSYVVYHASVPSTTYGGEGVIRYVYFFLLLSHILLSIIVVPFVLMAIYQAWTKKFEKHKKTVKYTFPIWLYVSITGVIVYLMISPYYNF